MELRQLGSSDLEISPIIFGAWAIGGWLWGGTDDDDAVSAIHAAIDSGINTIDTAPVYGFGHSESVVGRAIKGRRNDVIIATKCGPRIDRTDGVRAMDTVGPDGQPAVLYRVLKPDSILEECENSLKRLGIDHIDLYQCHWPDTTTPIADTMESLIKLKEQGKIRHIGVSNYSWERINESMHYSSIVSNQPRYNPLKRDIEAELLPWCRDNNVGIIAYSPMEHGLLSGGLTMDRTFPGDDLRSKHPWTVPAGRQQIINALGLIQPIADGHGATMAQLILNWVLGEPGVTASIAGTRNADQAAANAGAMSFVLTDEERAFVRAVFERLDPNAPEGVETVKKITDADLKAALASLGKSK
jgi:aryl-alcohol dehydrogenase-like predicted oxidoreductase